MTTRIEVKINKKIEKEKFKCIEFLKINGWESNYEDFSQTVENYTFNKPDSYSVDFEVTGDQMIFIDDTGDFLHMPVNLYSMIGVLIYHRMLPVCFKQN